MKQNFFFYDLETSGLKSREDRIMQFAGQRTTLDLEPIGEPVNILVKMTEDALPSPGAINVTKITPQQTLMDGVSEADFCRYVMEEIFVPGTVALGYNTVRFDDEFMRAILWRNFYDPYEWEWKDERSRWDMLDVVRMTRALRPEGINWPVTPEGKPTNRLELLTKENGLSHEHAHDALSDVYATIAVAKLIKEKQPSLFGFLMENRGKRQVQRYVNLENPHPVVYTSGRYANEFNKTTVVVPIAPSRNGNVLVYDLRYDLEELLAEEEPRFYPIVKELCYNKCPIVAPLSVLGKADGWRKIGLTQEAVDKNWEILKKHPEFAERMKIENESWPEFPPALEPEQAIYDGFLNDSDRLKVEAVRNAEPEKLVDFCPDFDDERLPELLLHYKGRNFPETLSEHEMEKWESYRRGRLERLLPRFLEELNMIQDDFVKEELKLYLESLA
ncbi:exodeoxyribonuclease I [Candidatus Saccharibacteria bacterium]|nr:exodeoxyribonuclease I [Candidatus Saccharibacteria bacterium]